MAVTAFDVDLPACLRDVEAKVVVAERVEKVGNETSEEIATFVIGRGEESKWAFRGHERSSRADRGDVFRI